jgi:hypothetical protein
MKNLIEEIKKFKQMTGLLLEDDREVCEKGDCKNGQGTLTKSGEWSYIGNFKNGKYDGAGVYTAYKDGNISYIFTGSFSNDLYSKGKLDHKTKFYVFEGDFKDDKPFKGTFTKDGITLRGTFSFDDNNKMHFISDDGKINTDVFDYITKQSCIEGDCENGNGRYLGPLGDYNGDFVNGRFEGEGLLSTNLSENEQVVENIELTKNFHDHKFTYTGTFKNGQLFGKGKIIFSDGSTYFGNFQENQIRGKGTFKFKNGSSYEGIFNTIPKGDDYKSTYSYETEDGLIADDLIEYNKDNSVQQFKYNKEEPTKLKNIIDLNVSITLGNENKILKGVSNNPLQGKQIKLRLENTAETEYKYEQETRLGTFPIPDFKYGNYNYVLIVKGVKKIKGNIIIGKTFEDGITFQISEKSKQDMGENINEGDETRMLKPEERKERNECETKIEEFHKLYLNFSQTPNPLDVYDEVEILEKKEIVQNCIGKYYKNHFSNKIKKLANDLVSVPPNVVNRSTNNLQYFFDINYNVNENKDIYYKTNTMSISNSLRKVIREYQENKTNLITERKIINNRFKFIVESNSFNKSICMRKLDEEKKNLINKGYNHKLIKESFIDIASSLYAGQSDVNILSDLKNKLGQKIADQVKNKQTEHEMILNAFNQIPDDVIKNSIDKSDISSLTNEIATRALENYKNQFGEGGIGAAFLSSVDTEKFKTEVNKVLKPAIEGLTNSIDDKVKKIRDVMTGNGQSDVSMSET